jgi:pimeloyl-ACP methyl ester carboxylesterase
MGNMRILCLHGYHGSGRILRSQMTPLSEDLDSAVDFVYVDAPSLSTGDFGWWHLNFRGWERTREWAVSLFRREPRFDGVFGFSQGAALTSLLVGMRAPDGRVTQQKPLSFDFAVMVGGFRSDSPAHAHLYAATESYELPSLHIIGQADRLVPGEDSRVLAAQFAAPVVLEHPGGHVIPGTPAIRRAFADFLHEQGERRVRRATGTRGSP